MNRWLFLLRFFSFIFAGSLLCVYVVLLLFFFSFFVLCVFFAKVKHTRCKMLVCVQDSLLCHVPKCAFHSSSIEILEMNFLYLLCSALTLSIFLFYLCCVCWYQVVNANRWYGSTFDRRQCQFPINYNILFTVGGTERKWCGVRSEEKTSKYIWFWN